MPQALIRSIRIGIASRYTIHTSSSSSTAEPPTANAQSPSSCGGWPVNQARALRISGVSGLSRGARAERHSSSFRGMLLGRSPYTLLVERCTNGLSGQLWSVASGRLSVPTA